MDLADIMESELSEHVGEQRAPMRFVEKNTRPSIRYVHRLPSQWEYSAPVQSGGTLIQYINPSTGRPVTFGYGAKPNTPSRFELDTMRDRLNSHRRWIQVGILIGAIGLGSRVPQFIEWYHNINKTPIVQEYVAESPPVLQEYIPKAPVRNTPTKPVVEVIQKVPQQEYVQTPTPKTKKSGEYQQRVVQQQAQSEAKKRRAEYQRTSETYQRKIAQQQAQSEAYQRRVGHQHHTQWQPVISWGGTQYTAQSNSNTSQKPREKLAKTRRGVEDSVKDVVKSTYRPPRRICIKNAREQRCYSRHTTNLRERQVYRRLEKRLRNQ